MHNLAYKIAFVLKGQAGDSLLDTYESERRHIAVVNSMQSVKNGKQIFGLLKTLGIGDDTVAARRNLYAIIGNPEKKKVIDEGIEAQHEHFDNVLTPSSRTYILPVITDTHSSSNCTLVMSMETIRSHQMLRGMCRNSKWARGCLMRGYGRHKLRSHRWTSRTSMNFRPRIFNFVNTAPWTCATSTSLR